MNDVTEHIVSHYPNHKVFFYLKYRVPFGFSMQYSNIVLFSIQTYLSVLNITAMKCTYR
jgi:hypothetical protein